MMQSVHQIHTYGLLNVPFTRPASLPAVGEDGDLLNLGEKKKKKKKKQTTEAVVGDCTRLRWCSV